VVALKGCLPLAEVDSRGADSAMVVGVRVGGVVEEAESPFFNLALAFGLVLPDKIGKFDVDSVIESPKHLSLRQSETVNSRAFS
nr:hypothetical protein [Tanacetum cinerariifolium]